MNPAPPVIRIRSAIRAAPSSKGRKTVELSESCANGQCGRRTKEQPARARSRSGRAGSPSARGEGNSAMDNHVYKIIELASSSTESVDDAIRKGVGRAS